MPSLKKLLIDLGASPETPNQTIRTFRKGLGMTLKEVESVTGIRESHLSAIETGKIEVTQHYAEVFAAAFGLHPTAFLYPGGEFIKTKDLASIERRAKKYIQRGRPKLKSNNKKQTG